MTITTSWDDGHSLDFKLAALLRKYDIKATFYIPKANSERNVMSQQQVRELSTEFEIGGHTLHHTRLAGVSWQQANAEIKGSFEWLSGLTGRAPVSFCFPGGAYDDQSLDLVFKSGYKLARTTELLSTAGLDEKKLLSTSLQVFQHSRFTYVKHLLKRRRWQNLVQWMKAASVTDLTKLALHYLKQAALQNGSFHLWGHSWEIDENNLWRKLEDLFKIIADHAHFTFVENRQLLNIVPTNPPPTKSVFQ